MTYRSPINFWVYPLPYRWLTSYDSTRSFPLVHLIHVFHPTKPKRLQNLNCLVNRISHTLPRNVFDFIPRYPNLVYLCKSSLILCSQDSEFCFIRQETKSPTRTNRSMILILLRF